MPHPHWFFFAVAVALIGVIEWEEFDMGYLQRGRGDRVIFWVTPLLYAAAALWIFIMSPLTFAHAIRVSAQVECDGHGGFDDSTAVVGYTGYPRRHLTEHISLRCNDGRRIYLRSAGGSVVDGDPTHP